MGCSIGSLWWEWTLCTISQVLIKLLQQLWNGISICHLLIFFSPLNLSNKSILDSQTLLYNMIYNKGGSRRPEKSHKGWIFFGVAIFGVWKIRCCSDGGMGKSKDIYKGRNNTALLIVVCLIPLVNSVIYLGSEIPEVSILYRYRLDQSVECNFAWNYYLVHVHFPLRAFTYSLAWLMQCIAYLSYFPRLRQGFFSGFSKLGNVFICMPFADKSSSINSISH